MTALTDAINQNAPGKSQGLPAGFDDTGKYGTSTLTPAPAGFTALTGWAVVYPQAGAALSPNAASDTVQVQGFTTYVHLTNGSWVQVQNQASDPLTGSNYVANFANDSHKPFTVNTTSGGVTTLNAPPAGYNDHFFPQQRGTYAAGTVDGVFVEAQMKTNDPNANLVAQLGADWWRSSSAPYVAGFGNNPVVGGNDFVKLTTSYQSVYYTSLSAAQLSADPPPGLSATSATTTTPTTPTTPTAGGATTTPATPTTPTAGGATTTPATPTTPIAGGATTTPATPTTPTAGGATTTPTTPTTTAGGATTTPATPTTPTTGGATTTPATPATPTAGGHHWHHSAGGGVFGGAGGQTLASHFASQANTAPATSASTAKTIALLQQSMAGGFDNGAVSSCLASQAASRLHGQSFLATPNH